MITFGYAIIYVGDVDAAIAFFENAFSLKRKFITEEKDYGELETGSTTLSFASHDLAKMNNFGDYIPVDDAEKPVGIELALLTQDVDAAHQAALNNGARELQAPAMKPWGQRVSYVQCPAGILLELCSPVQNNNQ